MTKHSTRTKGRIFMVITILIVGYIIFDRLMEIYKQPTRRGIPSEEAIITAKNAIKTAPQWKLNDLSGNSFNSDSLQGDVVLITFWTSTCSICRSEFPLLRKLQEEYKDNGFKVIAIALDEHEDQDLLAFTIGERLNYTVLRGNTKVAKAFGDIDIVPQSFLIDRHGNVIKFFLGKIDEAEVQRLIKSALSSQN